MSVGFCRRVGKGAVPGLRATLRPPLEPAGGTDSASSANCQTHGQDGVTGNLARTAHVRPARYYSFVTVLPPRPPVPPGVYQVFPSVAGGQRDRVSFCEPCRTTAAWWKEETRKAGRWEGREVGEGGGGSPLVSLPWAPTRFAPAAHDRKVCDLINSVG